MASVFIFNGEDVTGGQIDFNGGKFNPTLMTSAERGLMGIIELIEIRPTLGANQSYGGFTDDLVAKTRTYSVITITPEPITEVPLWKLKCILTTRGMIDGINAAIASLSEPNKTFATIAWEYANTIVRTSSVVVLIQAALSLTDADVDGIFNDANALTI